MIQQLNCSTFVIDRMIRRLNHSKICVGGVIQIGFGIFILKKCPSAIVLPINILIKLPFATAFAIFFPAEQLFTKVLTILFCAELTSNYLNAI